VKALQKDRIHIMNRYRHQLQTSPADAEANRPQMVDHLASSDRQLTAAIHMLDRLSHYKDKIMKQIGAYVYLPSSYHRHPAASKPSSEREDMASVGVGRTPSEVQAPGQGSLEVNPLISVTIRYNRSFFKILVLVYQLHQ